MFDFVLCIMYYTNTEYTTPQSQKHHLYKFLYKSLYIYLK